VRVGRRLQLSAYITIRRPSRSTITLYRVEQKTKLRTLQTKLDTVYLSPQSRLNDHKLNHCLSIGLMGMRVQGRSCLGLERGPGVTELVYWPRKLWHQCSRDRTRMTTGLLSLRLLNHLPTIITLLLISPTVFRYIDHVNFIFIDKFPTTSRASLFLSSGFLSYLSLVSSTCLIASMGRLTIRTKMTRSLRPWDTSRPSSESLLILRRCALHSPPFFRRVSYGRRLFRSALPSALWYVLVTVLRSCPLTSVQRACAHQSRPHLTRRYSSGVLHLYGTITSCPPVYDSIGMFLIGNVVLDSWSDHMFHLRRVISSVFLLPYLDAAIQGRQLLRLSALSPQRAVCA
jgi:hypothetical protein